MSEEKINLSGLSKRSLKEFNKAEAQGWIIERFVRIEERVDKIIFDFFEPANEEIFKSVVLNSSILSIGAKIKILSNIGIDGSILNKIRKLAAIRNGFSHSLIQSKGKVIISSNAETGTKIKTEY